MAMIRPETEMKDSGLAWEKFVPIEWNKCRLKDYFEFEKGKNAQIYTKDYIGLHKGNFPVYSGQTENEGVMGKIDTYDYELDECLFSTTVGAKVMTPKVLGGKFSLSQNCLIMRKIRKCVIRFIYYALFPLFDYERAKIPAYMQPSLRIEDLKTYNLYIPLYPEQQAIADYLDQTCSKIDEIIAEAKASIDEYKELRIAVVNDAVTHGIDNNAVKDSNVDWIGRIPDNWKIIITKRLFKIKKDIARKEGYTVLSITQKGIVPKVFGGKGQFAADYSNYQLVNKGDFAMNHMDLLTGWLDISEYDGVTSPDYRVFVPTGHEDIYTPYYKYVMQNCYSCKIYYGLGHGVAGVGRWRLPADMFLNFKLPMPPKEEQKKIADFLDKRTAEIDSLITEKEFLINDLEAYKKSLIYEVVTGKRRVV